MNTDKITGRGSMTRLLAGGMWLIHCRRKVDGGRLIHTLLITRLGLLIQMGCGQERVCGERSKLGGTPLVVTMVRLFKV